ncbi:MAG: PAS domain-containing protein [Spirochaetaceae bacterium]|nr:PAS domain-containing protein [Spirochaetaceae bacterium]
MEATTGPESGFKAFDALPLGVVVVDQDYRVRCWNERMSYWFGLESQNALGLDLRRLFPRLAEPSFTLRMRTLFEEGTPVVFGDALGGGLFLRGLDGAPAGAGTFRCTATRFQEGPETLAVLSVEERSVEARLCAGSAAEIERRRGVEARLRLALAEKEILLREMNHRIKNNLNLVMSLVSMQEEEMDARSAAAFLADLEARITSVAQLHELLYKSGNALELDCAEYLRTALGKVFEAFVAAGNGTRLEFELESVSMPTDSVLPIGLVATELLTNAIKYGTGARGAGRISVKLASRDGSLVLRVEDDGPGLPGGFELGRCDTFGLKLGLLLAEELHGSFAAVPGRGAAFELRVPLAAGPQ